MFEHTLNPVLLQLGSLEIRWYGLMWALSFVIVYLFLRSASKKKFLKLTEDGVDWLMISLVIGILVGARVFEVFIWSWPYYAANPAEIIAFWHGGLSFHGGLIGGLLAGYIFCRKKRISFLRVCDICIIPIAIAQILGRIGNFINGELWGRITNVSWAVKFPGAEGYRHPSQLYEALYNVVIVSLLFVFRKKKMPDGSLLAIFLVLYSFFRFITEYFREPSVLIGPLTLGQALNIPVFLGGIALFYWLKQKNLKT